MYSSQNSKMGLKSPTPCILVFPREMELIGHIYTDNVYMTYIYIYVNIYNIYFVLYFCHRHFAVSLFATNIFMA